MEEDKRMYDALTYQIMLEEIKENVRRHGILDDTIGILVTRPDLPTGKDILNSLEYFHFRTGKSVNFYLPGYGAYWSHSDYPDGKVVTVMDGVNWSFSNQIFVQFVSELEEYSKWKYSGESELLLVELKNGILSYENMMQFHLVGKWFGILREVCIVLLEICQRIYMEIYAVTMHWKYYMDYHKELYIVITQ